MLCKAAHLTSGMFWYCVPANLKLYKHTVLSSGIQKTNGDTAGLNENLFTSLPGDAAQLLKGKSLGSLRIYHCLSTAG